MNQSRAQRGLYYEELEEDVWYEHSPSRSITQAENAMFSSLTMNPASLHVDIETGRQGKFGRPLINSMWTLSTTVGLSVGQLTLGTTVANLGFERITFPAPLFPEDTITVRSRVLTRRESASQPDVGIVTFEHEARNQHQDIVALVVRSAMMRKVPVS